MATSYAHFISCARIIRNAHYFTELFCAQNIVVHAHKVVARAHKVVLCVHVIVTACAHSRFFVSNVMSGAL